MNWIKPLSQPRGFSDAAVVYTTESHLIAKWNHDRCRGWQLYAFRHRSRTRWLIGAGSESLGWTDEQAMRWAEERIPRRQGATSALGSR
jgi:hypothetical protein